MPNKQPVFTKRAPRPVGGYSQAIAVGDFVFTAGMGPIDPATGGVVGHDVATQTHQVMKNLAAVLAEAGVDLADVVKTTVHLQNLKHDFHAFDEAYRAHVTEPYPVRTTVGSDLAEILVEIDVVAARPTGGST